ncbi:MAG: hypothetical protein V4731_03325 [Pseudomonadota bacterium]
MPSNEKLAIAAHLHVLLRRKTGRVTDTEWMATNVEYAHEISRFARTKAVEDGHTDLLIWADRLDEMMGAPDPRKKEPLVQALVNAVTTQRQQPAAGASGTAPSRAAPARPEAATPSVPDQQGGRSVNTEQEVYPESGFIESTFGSLFGDSVLESERARRDPNKPRYVKGLR